MTRSWLKSRCSFFPHPNSRAWLFGGSHGRTINTFACRHHLTRGNPLDLHSVIPCTPSLPLSVIWLRDQVTDKGWTEQVEALEPASWKYFLVVDCDTLPEAFNLPAVLSWSWLIFEGGSVYQVPLYGTWKPNLLRSKRNGTVMINFHLISLNKSTLFSLQVSQFCSYYFNLTDHILTYIIAICLDGTNPPNLPSVPSRQQGLTFAALEWLFIECLHQARDGILNAPTYFFLG